MTDKVKIFIQKRTSLKAQITNLANLIDKGGIDNGTLKLRIERLKMLYHAFEEFNDELTVLDPSDTHQIEFLNIQDRFYSLAGKIEDQLSKTNTPDNDLSALSNDNRIEDKDSTTTVKRRRIKLPEAPLPTFDGKYENWLTFKNAFNSMIGSQADLTDIDKLHHLK